MENKINGSCDGRGCRIVILPWSIKSINVHSKVFRTKHDIQKIFLMANIQMDKKLA